MSDSVPKPFRMKRSPTAITCCATACGSRGSPKASDSRRTSVEKTGRISGANQRSIHSITPAVTITSATTTPQIPYRRPTTRMMRRIRVATEREKVSALKARVRCSIRITWNGMNVKPIAKVLSSTSCNASV